MDSLHSDISTPPHLRHHHRTLSSRVPYTFSSNTATSAMSSAAMLSAEDCREDEGLMFQLDLEDDKLAAAAALLGTSPKASQHSSWAYTKRLPAYSVSAQPLRPATTSPSFYRTSPLPVTASPSTTTKPIKCGSVQLVHRASLSPTIPTLSSRMRSSTVSTPSSTRTAVPSPSARLIKAFPVSPAASTSSSSGSRCVSQCASTSDDEEEYPTLDYTMSSPSPPSPASPIALLTSATSLHRTSSLPAHVAPLPLPLPLPVQPALPRASTGPVSKAQQWRSDKCMSVQSGSETKRASVSSNRPATDESEISTYIFELEL